MSFVAVLFYVLLADAVIANSLAWSGKQKWWYQHLGSLGQHFPLARGWTTYYLFLIFFIGWLLLESGDLTFPI